MPILALDHVQLAMPSGGEDAARAFYAGLLGMREQEKPDNLARRGGCWFIAGDARLHLGVEEPFRPAKKAHPALLTDTLETLAETLEKAGCRVWRDEPLKGYDRFYVEDPFGNRIEILQPAAGPEL